MALAIVAWILGALIVGCAVILIGCAVVVIRAARADSNALETSRPHADPIAHHARNCRCVGHR